MRVLFCSRPWTTELHVAVEEHWRERRHALLVAYVTRHLEARTALESAGRRVIFLPHEIRDVEDGDPYLVLERFEQRYGDRLLPLASWNATLPHGRHDKHREYDWLEPENVANVATAIEDVYARAYTARSADAAA